MIKTPPRHEHTSFCCLSSSFIRISRASARAARLAASLASACEQEHSNEIKAGQFKVKHTRQAGHEIKRLDSAGL